MRFLSHIKTPYRARYYDFELVGQGDQQTVNYFYDRDIKFAGGINGGRLIVYTPELLRVNGQVDTIVSVDGTLVMPHQFFVNTGTQYRITTVEPVLNVFGRREMYKYRLAA